MSLVEQQANPHNRCQQVQWAQPRNEAQKLDAHAPNRQSGNHPREPIAQLRMCFEHVLGRARDVIPYATRLPSAGHIGRPGRERADHHQEGRHVTYPDARSEEACEQVRKHRDNDYCDGKVICDRMKLPGL
jgi:hypothetical protein